MLCATRESCWRSSSLRSVPEPSRASQSKAPTRSIRWMSPSTATATSSMMNAGPHMNASNVWRAFSRVRINSSHDSKRRIQRVLHLPAKRMPIGKGKIINGKIIKVSSYLKEITGRMPVLLRVGGQTVSGGGTKKPPRSRIETVRKIKRCGNYPRRRTMTQARLKQPARSAKEEGSGTAVIATSSKPVRPGILRMFGVRSYFRNRAIAVQYGNGIPVCRTRLR